MIRLRRIIAIVVALLFAASASLYVASVPATAGAPGGKPAIAEGTGEPGGCHGAADDREPPAHPAAKTSCCDIACHAWLPAPALATLPPLPPAATADTSVAAVRPQPAGGIDRPPRA